MSQTVEPPVRPKLSPRKRAQRIRWVQYIVLVAVILLLAILANWPQIFDVFLRPTLIVESFAQGLLRALVNTVIYAGGAFILGLILGTILALMRLSSVGPYRWIAIAYIEFFRGLPALVVLIAISLLPSAIPNMQVPFGVYGMVWLGLGVVGSAYMAETIRAGILAVPKGQVEAARSLGMSSWVATRKIVLPQAFRIVLPPLTNELILLVKDSSLVYVVGLSLGANELTAFGRELANTEANLTPLVTAGFCYLLITLPLTFLARRLERSSAKAR